MADAKTGSKGFGDDDMTQVSGWDALLDDLFGLNVRALRTVGMSVISPAKLFTAARDADWLGRYTPSIRLVFTMIAAVVFLKFLWVNDTSGLFAYTQRTMEAMGTEFPGMTYEEATRDYLAALLVTYPFTYFGCHAVFSLLLNIWGKGTPLPVRIRLYFATLLPVMLMGVMMTVAYSYVTADQMDMWTAVGLIVMLVIYITTVIRGLEPVYSLGQRIWRGLLAGIVIGIADLAVALVSSTWAVTVLNASAT
ncbi:hypothetical protein K1X12_13530 [Hyphomonas sp. WL0036]|uniref:hypothetical protein n=1 Tax=Hyphomonas sediminis TaxID=2866160 RepID=UPI001C824A13|nr:hypothetical protein [Hyphomonas sediminis]MBY9067926.1 hypothetical protein [Hyphomonas sediminis]